MNAPGRQTMTHATNSTNLAELLERVLDKGVVIAGDIKIKLVEIELLTIQIRLVVCSVERAIDMGMDWWQRDPNLSSLADRSPRELQAARTRTQPWDGRPTTGSAEAMPTASRRNEQPELEARLRSMEETLRSMEARLASKTTVPSGASSTEE